MSTLLTSTPLGVSDGTKPVIVSIEGEINSTTKYLYYGFGATTPTEWHVYKSVVNSPMIVYTDFGKLWIKTDTNDVYVNITIGL
jgi:hypothetical protein